MKIILPAYYEAFSILKERVKKVEMNFENQSLMRLMASIDNPRHTNFYTYISSSKATDASFHDAIETLLQNAGGLKYRFLSKRNIR